MGTEIGANKGLEIYDRVEFKREKSHNELPVGRGLEISGFVVCTRDCTGLSSSRDPGKYTLNGTSTFKTKPISWVPVLQYALAGSNSLARNGRQWFKLINDRPRLPMAYHRDARCRSLLFFLFLFSFFLFFRANDRTHTHTQWPWLVTDKFGTHRQR